MHAIDVDQFVAAVREGVPVWDTRPAAASARDAVPGAVHVSVEQARRGRVPDIAHDTEVILVCEWGHMSELAGLYLEAHGFTRVSHLRGGIAELRKAAAGKAAEDVATDARPGTESR